MNETTTQTDPKTARLREFIALTARKRALDARLKDARGRLTELEDELAEQFQADGVQSVNCDGYTVYLQRKLWAGPADGDRDGMLAALKGCDETWAFLVGETVNSQQLAARIRECEQDASGMPVLPESLREAVHVTEQFRIGARKS